MTAPQLTDTKDLAHEFVSHYDTFRDEFLAEIEAVGITEPVLSWIKAMSDYNTKGGMGRTRGPPADQLLLRFSHHR